ncbi:MAG TPA: hypothetical protein VN711_00515 [Candidatus Saccharimonadales bacterium]|nr:hypothetical protein [Candidatus Saccharimonadales bacterium]
MAKKHKSLSKKKLKNTKKKVSEKAGNRRLLLDYPKLEKKEIQSHQRKNNKEGEWSII